jgi:hypothetical protein
MKAEDFVDSSFCLPPLGSFRGELQKKGVDNEKTNIDR